VWQKSVHRVFVYVNDLFSLIELKEMLNNFLALRSTFLRENIKKALLANNIDSEDTLKESIVGRSVESAAAFFEKNLGLGAFEASALAGLLVSPHGKNIASYLWSYYLLYCCR
jgi:hypothetical protein